MQADLFDPPPPPEPPSTALWRPRPCGREQWPPDYRGALLWRMDMLTRLRSDPAALASARAYYSTRPAEWITHWCDTYDPRKARLKWMPFILFERQAEYIQFLEDLQRDQEGGLVEKCRDAGVSWLTIAYTAHNILFREGVAVGWGSRKQDLVDKLGDMDSIFEKLRRMIDRLPDIWKPKDVTSGQLKFINNDNDASATGEAGDGIGRGGRKTWYAVDEAAHIERPETIEASLGDNTRVRVDISSVNGTGNPFHRKRETGVIWEPCKTIEPGKTRVFIFDWRDHPEKTQEWFDRRRAQYESQGMLHIFAQEVERNHSAAVEGVIISREWIEASVDAHLLLPVMKHAYPGNWMAGLDVADEGLDKNALVLRQGVILRSAAEWGERDPGVTTRHMLGHLREIGRRDLDIQYDCIGVGSAVRSEYNRLVAAGEIHESDYRMIPWHAGAKVVEPFAHLVPDDDKSPYNRDFFHNMKAQAWWSMRTRFYKTWKAVQAHRAGDVIEYDIDELVSIDSTMGYGALEKLKQELSQPTKSQSAASLKMVVDKTPKGTKSPNMGDAAVMAYFPAPEGGSSAEVGSYGG